MRALCGPDIFDYQGGGCLLEFLDDAGRARVVMACGKCSVIAFNDKDEITNIVSGDCGGDSLTPGHNEVMSTEF